jgi:MarR family multiple gene transcriptional regulator MgrA
MAHQFFYIAANKPNPAMVTLDQLIKIRSFQSEKNKLVVGLMYVAGLVKRHQENILSRENLTYQQFNVLRILRGQNNQAVSINVIKERMVDQTSDVSRITERLAKAGLITIKPNQNDKRVCDVLITKKGLDALAGIDRFSEEMNELPIPFSNDEAERMNLLLQQILDKLVE